jgi:hypothetical protein
VPRELRALAQHHGRALEVSAIIFVIRSIKGQAEEPRILFTHAIGVQTRNNRSHAGVKVQDLPGPHQGWPHLEPLSHCFYRHEKITFYAVDLGQGFNMASGSMKSAHPEVTLGLATNTLTLNPEANVAPRFGRR